MAQQRSGGSSATVALYHELPSTSSAVAHRVAPLEIDLLMQEWFVDPVPSALICCVCTEVVRDPPNLEACGQ
jgi:hypothetical protein